MILRCIVSLLCVIDSLYLDKLHRCLTLCTQIQSRHETDYDVYGRRSPSGRIVVSEVNPRRTFLSGAREEVLNGAQCLCETEPRGRREVRNSRLKIE